MPKTKCDMPQKAEDISKRDGSKRDPVEGISTVVIAECRDSPKKVPETKLDKPKK